MILKSNLTRFLNTYPKVKESVGLRNRSLAINSILNTRGSILRALEDFNDVSWLAPRGGLIPKKTEQESNVPLRSAADLPDSYWKSQQEFLFCQGRGVQLTESFKEEEFNTKLNQRTDSYLEWLQYLTSKDASYIPDHLIKWILDGLEKLGRYDYENNKFKKRRSKDVAPFVILYRDCLAGAVGLIMQKIEDPSFVPESESLSEIFKNETFPSFHVLYQYFFNKKRDAMGLSADVLLETSGRWVKFENPSDASKVSKILSLYPDLSWCIKSESVAHSYLEDANLYTYFSDLPESNSCEEWSEYGYPRLCIRATGDEIYEVRGCAKSQNIDSVMVESSVLKDKLKEFGDSGEEYLEIQDTLNKFSVVYNKYLSGEELSKIDLIAVLKLNPVSFGYEEDPRIQKFQRKIKRDWLCDLNLSGMDLSGVYFTDADLSGADLRGADLSGVDLTKADLSGADLREADLTGVNLNGADLSQSDFRDATLRNSSLKKAIFSETNFLDVRLEGVIFDPEYTIIKDSCYCVEFLIGPGLKYDDDLFEKIALENPEVFANASHRDSDFSECDFTGICLREIDFSNAILPEGYKYVTNGVGEQFLIGPWMNLSGVNLNGVDLDGVSLEDSDLSYADLSESNFTNVNFSGCVLEWANFESSRIKSSLFFASNLHRANFQSSVLTDVDFFSEDLEWATFESSRIKSSLFFASNLYRANFQSSVLTDVDFSDCFLDRATFESARID